MISKILGVMTILLVSMFFVLGSTPVSARPLRHPHTTRFMRLAAGQSGHGKAERSRRHHAMRAEVKGDRRARLARAHHARGRTIGFRREDPRNVAWREAHGTPPSRAGAQVGGASFYSGGGRTAAGGHIGAATCAHRSLPFGTRVLVTNLANARREVLTVNDRGPFARGRILDVSRTAAGVLGMLHSGVALIRMEVLGGPG